MNFTHLLAFYEVARAGSVSAGAERLRVSQPAVTREIRELEARLGIVLFDRLPRGVALTEAGRVLFDHAARIFALADAAQAELHEMAGLGAGQLKLGASNTLGVYWAPDLVSRFHAQFPRVAVELAVANTEQVEAGLRALRFALGFVEGPFDAAVFDARPIGADEIAVVAAANHPLAGKRLDPAVLADRAVILREPGSGTRAIVEEAYAKLGLPIVPRMSVGDTEAIKRMLLAQPALAYLSVLSVRDEIARGDLRIVQVDAPRIERALHMVWLKGRSLSPAVQALMALVAPPALAAAPPLSSAVKRRRKPAA
ncbi:LysR family transcriptional regulator [Burkholderia sp. Ac-20379]|uniref:LysR family transcriptional regulator n=1 Tax=Burkholderia sp. Ac-20379 TaxID=2703900 RepID=UPI00197D9FFD|nr:LysR family transcriptional regulator [Burkholderia sp. Ac-20379]MBN3725020.1 LysR family transcriptional regulator [Burkholderia sp. Ac-20379]